MADYILIDITGGAIRNSYLSVFGHLDWFPEDAIASDENTKPEKLLTLHLDSLDETTERYILDNRNRFSGRDDLWKRFYQASNMVDTGAGRGVKQYSIKIEKLSEYSYRVSRYE